MKYYAQFLTLSTGYVQGTIPPIFRDDNKRPIDLLGTDGVCHLDARFNIDSMIDRIIFPIWNLHRNKNSIVGFEIRRANSFNDKNEKVIYRYIK